MSSAGLRFKRIVVVVALAAMASGASYAFIKFVKWVGKGEESEELAALVSHVRRPNASKSLSPREDSPATEETVNKMLPDVPFVDLLGRRSSLRKYRGSILVASVTSADCPVSKKLVPALSRLSEEFRHGGVRFLLVNADKDASQTELESQAALLPNWRYVHDYDSRLARALTARTTAETFVIDEAQTLRYRGSIDNRYDVGVTRPAVGPGYLRDAIAAILQHEPLSLQVTPAPGCVLGLHRADEPSPPVTWHNQISRLIEYNCVECHRPGEAAPFSLEGYERVVAKKAMIQRVLERRIMPPWFADHSYGEWRNERFVSDADLQMFSQWVLTGCAKGDPVDAPAPVKRVSGWTIRQPDIILDVEPQEVPADGYVEWRKFPVPFEVTTDLWVSEAEIRPSVPEVVHHAMLYVEYPKDDPRRVAQTRAESEASGGAGGFWLSYFPGRKALVLPPGRGKLIPRNGRIFIQLHYSPNGTATIDRTRIGFKLLPGAPTKAVVTSSIVKWDFRIPPNSLAQFLHSEVFDEDVRLLALMPHMHSRGSAAQVFILHPDGRPETLLNVPKYEFDWQVSYEFQEPLLVTRGSRIIIVHEYDNTSKNPRNPDPTKEVRHGNRTSDDMMINFFDWEPAGDEPPPTKKKRRPFR